MTSIKLFAITVIAALMFTFSDGLAGDKKGCCSKKAKTECTSKSGEKASAKKECCKGDKASKKECCKNKSADKASSEKKSEDKDTSKK